MLLETQNQDFLGKNLLFTFYLDFNYFSITFLDYDFPDLLLLLHSVLIMNTVSAQAPKHGPNILP